MCTEFQYNLQKARALATELRITMEAITEELEQNDELANTIIDPADGGEEAELLTILSESNEDWLEGVLDALPSEIIGDGHVKLVFPRFTRGQQIKHKPDPSGLRAYQSAGYVDDCGEGLVIVTWPDGTQGVRSVEDYEEHQL